MRASLSFFFKLLAQMWGFGTDAEAVAGLIAPLDSLGSTPSSSSVGGGRVESLGEVVVREGLVLLGCWCIHLAFEQDQL